MKNRTQIFFAIIFFLVVFGLAQAYKHSEQRLREANNGSLIPVSAITYDPAPVPKTTTQYIAPKPAPIAPAPDANKCYVGGCSGQICSDSPDVVSTCEFREDYVCYSSGITKCERQLNGQCGWTQNAALSQCLEDNPPQMMFQ